VKVFIQMMPLKRNVKVPARLNTVRTGVTQQAMPIVLQPVPWSVFIPYICR